MDSLVHPQCRKMHKNEDIFVKQAQEFSPRLFYFALWHGGQTSDKGEKNPSLFNCVII
jgi:hypothetical protein